MKARRSLIVLLASAVLALSVGIHALAGPKSDSDKVESVIAVAGSSMIQVKPDLASVTLGADSQASTAKTAQEANARVMTAIIKALTDMGIAKDDIRTNRFSLNPIYSYDSKTGKSKLEGYRVDNRVVVTLTDLAKVGSVIDASIQAGANNVESIAYSLKDVAKAKATALKLAAKDAQARAKILAEAMDMRIKGLKTMTDNNIEFAPLVRNMDKAVTMRAMGAEAVTPIQEGDLEVRAMVNAEFVVE